MSPLTIEYGKDEIFDKQIFRFCVVVLSAYFFCEAKPSSLEIEHPALSWKVRG